MTWFLVIVVVLILLVFAVGLFAAALGEKGESSLVIPAVMLLCVAGMVLRVPDTGQETHTPKYNLAKFEDHVVYEVNGKYLPCYDFKIVSNPEKYEIKQDVYFSIYGYKSSEYRIVEKLAPTVNKTVE